MAYIQNAWYVAAWSSEVSEQFLTRTLLETPLLLYREGARVVAMHDRCPHRFAPLSRGSRVDGLIRCGYHGLSFDSSGECRKSLFSAVAPKAAKVRIFPTHEQDQLVWIWMGEQPAAAITTIPRLPFHADAALHCQFGYTHAKADYRLLSDNLMDLTHTALLHPSFGGLDYIPVYKCWEEHDQIFSQYTIEHMPSFLTPGSGELLRNQDTIRWIAPATHCLDSQITLDDGKGATVHIPSAHILTPETTTTSHYFWSSAAPAGIEISDEDMRASLIQAFDHEDKPMVEAVQRRMGTAEFWDLHPVLLNTDAGSVRVRRRIDALMAAEQAQRNVDRAATTA